MGCGFGGIAMLFGIGLATMASTFLGGAFALRLKDRLHLIAGFAAGAVLGVAFFELLPETFRAANLPGNGDAPLFIALGFAAYLVLDRGAVLHSVHHQEHHEIERTQAIRGSFGAASLSMHSYLDGVAIGLGFATSSVVGLAVTAAVLAHDFSDGINTVSVILRHGGNRRSALRWLLVDALTPMAGILTTLAVPGLESQLGRLLALFCGFFLYIGASDLLPESHHAHPTRWTTVATLLGLGLMFVVTRSL